MQAQVQKWSEHTGTAQFDDGKEYRWSTFSDGKMRFTTSRAVGGVDEMVIFQSAKREAAVRAAMEQTGE